MIIKPVVLYSGEPGYQAFHNYHGRPLLSFGPDRAQVLADMDHLMGATQVRIEFEREGLRVIK